MDATPRFPVKARRSGQECLIIDVKDLIKPKYLSEYQHPNARIHDLWVRNGIAYSAQGGVGAVSAAVSVANSVVLSVALLGSRVARRVS